MMVRNFFVLNRLSFVFLFVVAGLGGCKKTSSSAPAPPVVDVTTFTNPLLPSGPDPWIIQKDNQYYYTHTLGNRIALWKTASVSALSKATPQNIWTAPVSGANAKN
ncbi:MAG TPA: hypothetical protein VFT06_04470, partial [Flavisolibacter sp.]|nr:hypothetical protein [Flavisolibacter sp.]